MPEDKTQAQKNLDESVKQLTVSVNGIVDSFEKGRGQIKGGVNELFGGGGPLGLIASEIGNVVKKFAAIKDIAAGSVRMILSPLSAFQTKEVRQAKKTEKIQQEQAEATKENTESTIILTKAVKKLAKVEEEEPQGDKALLTAGLFSSALGNLANSVTNLVPNIGVLAGLGAVTGANHLINKFFGNENPKGWFQQVIKTGMEQIFGPKEKLLESDGSLRVTDKTKNFGPERPFGPDGKLLDETDNSILDNIKISNEGGNYDKFKGSVSTGSSPRSGGVDGIGGMLEIVHPQEFILDQSNPKKYPHIDETTGLFVDPNDPNSVKRNEEFKKLIGTFNTGLKLPGDQSGSTISRVESKLLNIYESSPFLGDRIQPNLFGGNLGQGNFLPNQGIPIPGANIKDQMDNLSFLLTYQGLSSRFALSDKPTDLRGQFFGDRRNAFSNTFKVTQADIDELIASNPDKYDPLKNRYNPLFKDPNKFLGISMTTFDTPGRPPGSILDNKTMLPFDKGKEPTSTIFGKDKSVLKSGRLTPYIKIGGLAVMAYMGFTDVASMVTSDKLKQAEKEDILTMLYQEGVLQEGDYAQMLRFVDLYHNKTYQGGGLQEFTNLGLSSIAFTAGMRSMKKLNIAPSKLSKVAGKSNTIYGKGAQGIEFLLNNASRLITGLAASAAVYGISDWVIEFLKETNKERQIKKIMELSNAEYDELYQGMMQLGVFDNDTDAIMLMDEINRQRLNRGQYMERYKIMNAQQLSLFPPIFDASGKLSFDPDTTTPRLMSRTAFNVAKSTPGGTPNVFLLKDEKGNQTIYANGRLFTFEQLDDINANNLFVKPESSYRQFDLNKEYEQRMGQNGPTYGLPSGPVFIDESRTDVKQTGVKIDPSVNTNWHFYNSSSQNMSIN